MTGRGNIISRGNLTDNVRAERDRGLSGKRILWIDPFAIDDALHKADTLEILTGLSRRGFKTFLMTTRSRRVLRTEEDSQIRLIVTPLRYLPLLSPVMYAILLFFLMPFSIARHKPDFVVARPDISTISLIPFLLFCKSRRAKFVLDVRSTPVETSGVRGFLQNLWFAPSVALAKKHFDGLTVISLPMKKEVCENFSMDPSKVGMWTSGVSLDLFNPGYGASQRIELRKKLGLSGKFVVFYHGVFTATRGLMETSKAIKIVKAKAPNIVFFLLGTGPMTPFLQRFAFEEEVQDRIIIHRPVDHKQVPKYIATSDVCIIPLPNHPYWRNQSPLKLLEYLAMEKVVIATDIPAHRMIIGGRRCGIYIQSIDPVDIAKSMLYAYDNRVELEKWGRSGRKIVEKEFAWEKVAKDLEDYLLSINNT